MSAELVKVLLEKMLDAAQDAHHYAFKSVDGHDPEWPMWYAAYLLEDVNELLQAEISNSDLVDWLLIATEAEREGDLNLTWSELAAATILKQRLK